MIEKIPLFGSLISLYYLFWVIGAVVVLIVGCQLGKWYGFSVSRTVLYITGTIALGYLLLWATSWVFGGGKMNGLNFVRIVTFLPVAIFLLSQILKASFWDVSDMLAPLVAIFHGVTHIGCIFPGCCHGYPSQWGLYSNEVRAVCFPSQPLEALSSILIGVLLIWMMKHSKEKGKLYAWYLTLFGGTRFLWEFLRDNEKIWHNLSELALHALAAMVLGLIALAVTTWVRKGSSKHEEI